MRYFRRIMRAVLVIVVTAALVGGVAVQVQRKQKSLAEAPKFGVGPVPVHVVQAQAGELDEDRQYLAVVEPRQTADVAARVTAEVESVSCDEGDVVKAGQAMAVLDNREMLARIEALEAQIGRSEAELQSNQVAVETLSNSVDYWARELARDQSLREGNAMAISEAEVEATAEKLQAKRGELDAAKHRSEAIKHTIQSLNGEKQQLETNLDYCTIRSPFDGVVVQREVDPGHMASPGKVLFVVEDRSLYRLAFEVPQDDLADIRPGLDVTFTMSGGSCSAKLSRLYPSLNAARMVRAEVDLAGQGIPKLTAGAYVPVSVTLRTVRGATLIPTSALADASASEGSPNAGTAAGEERHVFVVREHQLELRRVTILATRHGQVAVKGLQPGESVLETTFLGWTRYAPGQKVEVIQ